MPEPHLLHRALAIGSPADVEERMLELDELAADEKEAEPAAGFRGLIQRWAHRRRAAHRLAAREEIGGTLAKCCQPKSIAVASAILCRFGHLVDYDDLAHALAKAAACENNELIQLILPRIDPEIQARAILFALQRAEREMDGRGWKDPFFAATLRDQGRSSLDRGQLAGELPEISAPPRAKPLRM
jgi:hypothetical protein